MQNLYSDNQNIGLRHFRVALAVATERSFTAAAARLGVATSAVTEAVQQIEIQTGALLFERRSRPIGVTPAGERFVDEARQILAVHQRALRDLGQVGGLEGGLLPVAGAPSLVKTLLIPAIRDFSARHPGVRIAVHDDVAGRIEARILGKEVEFAVAARWAPTTELDAEEIGRDEIVLVCHRDNPLAACVQVSFDEVPADSVISLMSETGISKMLKTSMRFPRALLEGRLQAFSTISQLMMVKAGLGVAFLPRLAAGVMGEEDVACLRVRGLALQRPYYILSERKRTPSPAAEALKAFVREVARGAAAS
jgi:DNA-binding transcriptional LysR family regulator